MEIFGATRWEVEKLTLMALHPTEFDTPEFRHLCEEAGMVFQPDLEEVLADARKHLHPHIP